MTLQERIAALRTALQAQHEETLQHVHELEMAVVDPSKAAQVRASQGRRRYLLARTVITQIRAVLPSLPPEFSATDVERAVQAGNPRFHRDQSSYTARLMDLAASGEVKVVRLGSGRRPTLFGKP